MTSVQLHFLWCDHEDECDEESPPEHSLERAIEVAVGTGWTHHGQWDFCPNHRPDHLPASTEEVNHG